MLLLELAALAAAAAVSHASTDYYWYDKAQTLADRPTMVHLFEWKWKDVATECEDFLAKYKYGAVQVSPPMEHITLVQNGDVPWWVRYQPVSYKLHSRSGSEDEFKDMVERCNKVGVRIIVDVVMNHMVGMGQKNGENTRGSSGGSDYNGYHGVESFPAVPFGPSDFNDKKCDHDIGSRDYSGNANNVRNCRLSGLLDLDQSNTDVQKKIVAYLDKLVDYGVAGFRCDASKHMWPENIKQILDKVKDLRADIFGNSQRPFAVHEVIDRGGEAVKCIDYIGLGRYTNFNFGSAVSAAAKKQANFRDLSFLGPGFEYGNYDDHDVLNFIDNHDNQRDSNPYVTTYKDGDKHKLSIAFLLAWPYGYPRVMSSYSFDHSDQGPPNSGAASGYATTSPQFASDETCEQSSGWVCEHRWPSTREMVKFRSSVAGTAAAVVTPDQDRIAFARDRRGFFALNNNNNQWSRAFQTTLPAGKYCDQFGGKLDGDSCTGMTITVEADGIASLYVPSGKAVAFSMSSRIGGEPAPKPTPAGYQKTIIFMKKQTNPGENLFIRGGTSLGSCSPGPHKQSSDPCAVPIVHNTTTPFVYAEYRTWSQHDDYLDWEGDEATQGTHDGRKAFGSPLAYSTNDPTQIEYQPANKYGAGYWMMQVLMDCSKTREGWFEIKGYLSPESQWEGDIHQAACSGSAGGTAPFSSINHVAKCGATNVFEWDENSCIIDIA